MRLLMTRDVSLDAAVKPWRGRCSNATEWNNCRCCCFCCSALEARGSEGCAGCLLTWGFPSPHTGSPQIAAFILAVRVQRWRAVSRGQRPGTLLKLVADPRFLGEVSANRHSRYSKSEAHRYCRGPRLHFSMYILSGQALYRTHLLHLKPS